MKLLTSTLALTLTLPLMADVFVMKDGTRLNGKILEKTADEYVLEVAVTNSIKERRTVKRDDVEEIERVSEAEEGFKKISDLTPAPPYLSLKQYDARIKVLEEFVSENKITTSGSKAQDMIEELKNEREVIAAGGVKTKEGLLTAYERASDRLSIESRKLAQEFRELVNSRAYIPALRKFEELEAGYAGTEAHRDALPLFEKLLQSYLRIVSGELDSFAANQERRDMAYERLSDNDKERALAANDQRMLRLEKIREQEKEKGYYWLTVDTQNENSLADAEASLKERIESLPGIREELAEMPDVGQLYKDGWEAAGKKETEKLEQILDEMDAAGVAEEDINRLIDRYDPTINNPVEETEKTMESEEDADTDPEPSE
jgi:hypothetical protein